MDYTKLSDGQISVLLANLLKPKYEAEISPHHSGGAQLSWDWCGTKATTGFFPLHKSGRAFPGNEETSDQARSIRKDCVDGITRIRCHRHSP
ncbi:hypothetical protein [Citrobacter koseri]|uniref:hypothetical protein n=1 Tax=Citrobacter koseri TaxID=545 RepID=UPI002162DBB2|nr:hypothetical protein [Citrobacter koseri]